LKDRAFSSIAAERDDADLKRQLAEAKSASTKATLKPASLEDCKRLGIEVVWFTPTSLRGMPRRPRAHICRSRVTLDKLCLGLLGEVPLKVDIAKQAKGFLVIRFSEQGSLTVQRRKNDTYWIKNAELMEWLTAQGVPLGAYPVEWEAVRKCLYLKLTDVIPKTPKEGKA